MSRRVAGYFMAFVFVVMAGVQYNDPDPLRWMAIYGVAATAALLFAFDKLHITIPVVIGVVAIIWALLLAPDVIGKVSVGELFQSVQMKNQAVERGREMGGLLIVVACMALLFVVTLRRRTV